MIRMSQSSAILEHGPSNPGAAASRSPQSEPPDTDVSLKTALPGAESEVGCPMCGNLASWGNSSWCPECGFYPRLGISLGPTAISDSQTLGGANSRGVSWQRIPLWAKILAAGVVFIVAANIGARLAIPKTGTVRTLVAFLQLVAGLGIAALMHCAAFFKAAMSNHRFYLIDAVLHPVETWKPTLQELPRTARRVWLGVWGLTCASCAVVIIGGIRYSALVDDWGFRNRVATAMASRVRIESIERLVGGGTLAGNLEEEVQKRAEQEAKEAALRAQNGSELEMQTADCVVIGYTVSARDGSVSELYIASLVNGELKYVGTVKQGIPEGAREELSRRLPDLQRDTPFVDCPGTAIWVKPVVACKTSFQSWTEDHLLNEATFKELMSEIGGVE
jgi:hypothetical protein